jgi:hypothetical protein
VPARIDAAGHAAGTLGEPGWRTRGILMLTA